MGGGGAYSLNLLLFTAIVFGPNSSTAQSNPCETSGNCGVFGICDPQDSPMCSCLQGFFPRNSLEWDSGNWSSGCLRRAPLNCEGNNGTTGELDGFLKLDIMMFTGNSDRWFGPENQCQSRCLSNCSCLAYGFQDSGCIFWSQNLTDIQKVPNPSGSAASVFIRVSNSELDRKKGSKKIVIILVVLVIGFVVISICAFFSWKWIVKRRGQNNTMELAEAGAPSPVVNSLHDSLTHAHFEELPLFKFDTLAHATNDFSEANKLGKGGFGSVYKGDLLDGREIAVKRLSQASTQGKQEFMNEVVLISKLQHRNLVRLLGCCSENKEIMLVYEYMPHKSLDFFLFDSSQEILDWRKRFNIIEGICRGLLYLHRDSRLKIIHRDLKPSNILLDNDWNPKISDFGMARIFGTKQDHVSTIRVVGTYGYMAPEYAMEGKFSEKSDVFSFGVLVLEIATGRRNSTGFHNKDDHWNLMGYVWKLWSEDNVAASIDPRISSSSYQAEVVRCIHIGLLCVQQHAYDRPSISAVLSMLSSEIADLPKPKRAAFTMRSAHPDKGTSSSRQSQQSSASTNDVTLTAVHGR